MERKHATVIALTFVLVGLMFFSVDTPLVLQPEVETAIHEAPEIIEQLAAEPVPQEPLTLNVMPNPSFEDWNTADRPEVWSSYVTAQRYTDDAYSGSPKHDSYAGYLETMGSVSGGGYTDLRNSPDHSTHFSYLSYSISLTFDWYVLANPDLSNFGQVYLSMIVQNTTGDSRGMYYYLSHGSGGGGNDTSNVYFLMNNTIDSWNSFDRNITEDFVAAFGSGALSSTHYVQRISFEISSPVGATDMVQVVFDDVSLFNSTYTSWIINGDFESGTGANWDTSVTQNNIGQLEKCTDVTDGTYSANMSITATHGIAGYSRVEKNAYSQNSYFAYGPGTNVISWDWKYTDQAGGGASQYALLRLQFRNDTTYSLYFTMGRGDDYIPNNGSAYWHFTAPGFGTRDSWVHSEIDLYEVTQQVGIGDLQLYGIRFEAYQSVGIADAKLQVLVDDFRMDTHPMGNPSFEYVDLSMYDPFQGWGRTYGQGEVTQTTAHHSGSYAANITVEDGTDGIYRSELFLEYDPALSIDFWWRLDDIQGVGTSYALIEFDFVNHLGGNNYLIYVLGKSSSYTTTNNTQTRYIMVDGFNQTDTWTLLSQNITADIEEGFSYTGGDWTIYQVTARCFASAGMKTSLLVDDFNFKDMVPPSIDAVAFSSTQYYYYNGYLQVSASDVRPGVSDVTINYTTNGGTSWNTIATTYNSDWYEVNIPAQDYGTTVEFSVIATDGGGLVTVDDNGGAYYSYYVDDNADPLLTITDPVNNTDQSGLLAITADAFDAGAGVEYVRFNPDGSGAVTDYTAPYSQNWNLDDESLGSHFIIVTVRDNAGNEVTKTHYITVVDTVDPVLDSPDDVEFTVGETGYTIDWNPTDVRPTTYEIFIEEVSTFTGSWNSSAEHLVIELDGLAVGTYNYTCVVYDEAGLSAVDTVMVTVIEVVTTSTTPTTTTGTTDTTTTTADTTSDTTTTSSEPTGGGDIMTPLLIVAGVGVVGILLIVFVVLPKMKKS